MKKITCANIEKQAEAWINTYEENNQRGKEAILFGQANEQWDQSVVSDRYIANKESLTFNQCLKLNKKVKAQAAEIDFSLKVAPTNKEVEEQVEENNAYRLLLNTIMLNDDMEMKFEQALCKAVDYGYAAAEVNYERESEETLCLIPVLRVHEDPSIAFWDKNAPDRFRVKGRFCGLRKLLSRDEVLNKYPKYSGDEEWIRDKDNIIIDYWFRDYKKANFVLLKTGIYRREDLMTIEDKENVATEEDVAEMMGENYDEMGVQEKPKSKPLVREDNVCCIYFTRICNNRIIQKPTPFPTDDLPLVYHPALTVWVPERGYLTFPYIFPMMGAQKLHNYAMSQIATGTKNSSADKWLMGNEHVLTEDNQLTAKRINTLEGALVLSGEISKIRREQPAEIPQSLIAVAQAVKQEIEEIAGVMIDSQNTDQMVISGVALDKLTHNMGVINNDVLGVHIDFVNQIGKLIRQMIPRLYTEQRTLVLTNKDGSGQVIQINEDLGTGEVRNNVRDINANFSYEIVAGPSSTMQKENTIKYLMGIYQIAAQAAPQVVTNTLDVFFRNLDSPDAGELERRTVGMIDPNLIKYSQGAMSLEDYQKGAAQQAQQQQQQQLQQQMQLAQMNPQAQAEMEMAKAEGIKAQSGAQIGQFDAETRRMAAASKSQMDLENVKVNQAKVQVQVATLMAETQDRNTQQAIDGMRAQLEADQQVIDAIHTSNQQAMDAAALSINSVSNQQDQTSTEGEADAGS